jgi:ABC-2 type transport system ATP-binding protein
LVLDEPTLGLDLIYRKSFYDSLLNDYFDKSRTVIVSTHQVEEIEHILTDVLFIDRGRIALDASLEALEARFAELVAAPERLAEARALSPIAERQLLGRATLLYDGVPRDRLAPLGEVRTPGLADLFVALMSPRGAQIQGAAA